ncbi:chromosome segregation protein SMC [Haloimpatiens sp. FM7330]|uniref:chromosome segregation protein SMC n=1 Tax=Haloimpatiens sp. FM7330 TaxID=3298610 RepID=UPI00363219BA
MFLKSLEIRGFKSFADKTEVVFNKGITAVVGPNGSGKSNISDAVRWALGEQSVKTLRGGKMEDVIFAGTQYRKPVGLAQVSLILDNNDNGIPIDYCDVRITRRLYRSGESEYYINNTKCRLKDIQELFMDTGIGKEGYSIIGQGKIDAILSGKAEDRRKLLEEAAGIVKFKTRKVEAERRLENTEQNLTRINDILNTYEERIGPLEIEKNKAKEFLKLSEELKIKEVNVLIENVNSVENKINKIKEEINKLSSKGKKLNEERQKIREKDIKLNSQLENFDENLKKEKQIYYDRKSQHKDKISEIDILTERINNLNNSINKTSIELEQIHELINEFKVDKDNKEKQLKEHQDNQGKLNEKIIDLEKNIFDSSIFINEQQDVIEKLKNCQMDVIGQITDMKNKKIILTSEIDDLKKKYVQITNSYEGYNNSIEINTNTKQVLSNEKDKIKNKIEEYKNIIKECKSELSKRNSQLLKEQKEVKVLSKQQNTLEANKNILINLDKQYEGYNKSVKSLMKHINDGKIKTCKDDCYVVGEVIKVPEKLEIAVEIALGGAISNIITKNEQIAKNLIKYLKDKRLGRATFLPMNIIKSKKNVLPYRIKELKGYVGIASELLKYDNKFKNIIEYILGRTIISQDIDCALNIAKMTNYKFKIVTIGGEVINPGGALTGGSIYHKSTSIIGRKREIEQLGDDIQKVNRELKLLSKKIKNNEQDIKNLDEKCLNLRDEIHYENLEIAKIDGKMIAIENETKKLIKNLSVSEEEANSIKYELNKKNMDMKQSEEKLIKLKQYEKDNHKQITNLECTLKNKLVNIDVFKENLTELKIKKAQIDEIVVNKINELKRITKDIENSLKKVEILKKDLNQSKLNHEESINKINSNKIKVKDILDYLKQMSKSFEEKEVERIKMKEYIHKNKENLEELNIAISEIDKSVYKLKITLTKFESEIETIYNKLNNEFELTYAEALEYKFDIEDLDNLKSQIIILKNKISALGVVNLGAIKEYEEVKTKFDFMNTQKEDLTNAREELLSVIKDMTSKMRVIFNENFQKLRKLFNDTFKELFKGGSADLILGEGDELTSKIDINVQPPGKKLQNINLMSGGEKVLSAIALLFAILKMKPTPFCILDEIEAALDDANVVRYGEFLKEFSNNVQFIIITHRKGTMEASDVMYGITMQEKGISKVVSVDLTK